MDIVVSLHPLVRVVVTCEGAAGCDGQEEVVGVIEHERGFTLHEARCCSAYTMPREVYETDSLGTRTSRVSDIMPRRDGLH